MLTRIIHVINGYLYSSSLRLITANTRTIDEITRKRLRMELRASIGRILSGQLPSDPGDALSDLVYVIETVMSLRLASDDEITPVFRELWDHRKTLNVGIFPELVDIQERLREMVLR